MAVSTPNSVIRYQEIARKVSFLITRKYSTSFFTASLLFPKNVRQHIFNIYGFVRLSDEIVDTFHDCNKKALLSQLENDVKRALQEKFSINPVLHAFQETVHTCNIPIEYIDAFLHSMRLDTIKKRYLSDAEMKEYVYGSAEVVGLMCLRVFYSGQDAMVAQLEPYAIKLGSAFQKVNFLRDLAADYQQLGRLYFPAMATGTIDEATKLAIIQDIENEFRDALKGIDALPLRIKMAVYTAYLYYEHLLSKLKRTPVEVLMQCRVRVSNARKFLLLVKAIIMSFGRVHKPYVIEQR